MYSLYAETVYGYNIKIMADVLQNCLGSEAYFDICESGIYLCNTDNKETILINVSFAMENFDKFVCKNKISIALTIKHLNKLLKNIKKKDSISLFIKDDIPNKLGIKITPSSTSKLDRVETSYITFREINNISISVPDTYSYPKIIPTSEYQKMCKRMNIVPGKIVKITIHKNLYISFFCDGGDVISSEMTFGDLDPEVDEEDVYKGNFYASMLSQLIKIPGLAQKMQIYAPEKNTQLPLKMKINIGNLGFMEIYIKTKEQIDYEHTKLILNEE